MQCICDLSHLICGQALLADGVPCMQGTELNPDFFLDIVAAVSKDLGAVLLCNIGGKLDVTDTNPAGTQSRQRPTEPWVSSCPKSIMTGHV